MSLPRVDEFAEQVLPHNQWVRIVATILRIDWCLLTEGRPRGRLGSDRQTAGQDGCLIDMDSCMQMLRFADELLYDVLLQIIQFSWQKV